MPHVFVQNSFLPNAHFHPFHGSHDTYLQLLLYQNNKLNWPFFLRAAEAKKKRSTTTNASNAANANKGDDILQSLLSAQSAKEKADQQQRWEFESLPFIATCRFAWDFEGNVVSSSNFRLLVSLFRPVCKQRQVPMNKVLAVEESNPGRLSVEPTVLTSWPSPQTYF